MRRRAGETGWGFHLFALRVVQGGAVRCWWLDRGIYFSSVVSFAKISRHIDS